MWCTIADALGACWFKSTYSESGGQCVEVAFLDAASVGIRDSKNPGGPVLIFGSREWDAFIAGL
ncbi:DUF397 domain-containing protein [Nocardia sp. IFM 10818]